MSVSRVLLGTVLLFASQAVHAEWDFKKPESLERLENGWSLPVETLDRSGLMDLRVSVNLRLRDGQAMIISWSAIARALGEPEYTLIFADSRADSRPRWFHSAKVDGNPLSQSESCRKEQTSLVPLAGYMERDFEHRPCVMESLPAIRFGLSEQDRARLARGKQIVLVYATGSPEEKNRSVIRQPVRLTGSHNALKELERKIEALDGERIRKLREASRDITGLWRNPMMAGGDKIEIRKDSGGTYYVKQVNTNDCYARDTMRAELNLNGDEYSGRQIKGCNADGGSSEWPDTDNVTFELISPKRMKFSGPYGSHIYKRVLD